MRNFIRHPSDIPIFVDSDTKVEDSSKLSNISLGGLAFASDCAFEVGHSLSLRIDVVKPAFEVKGIVTHCDKNMDNQGLGKSREQFVIGIEFQNSDDLFTTRMVEQVCYIELYKRQIEESEHRQLSGQEAAKEWISKYAANFPSWHES